MDMDMYTPIYRDWLWWLGWMPIRLLSRRWWVQSPPGLAKFFSGDWSWNIFYGHSLLSADSRRSVVSFWWKNVHTYWLIASKTKPSQEKVWLGKLTTFNMILMSWLGHKTSMHTNKYQYNGTVNMYLSALRDILGDVHINIEMSMNMDIYISL